MQRKSPVWSQLLSFFKLRNSTQKGTRVVTWQAIKPQVDRRICIGQLFERINHISSFLCIIIRAPTLKNIVITSCARLSVRPSTLSLCCNNLNTFLVIENWMFVYESSGVRLSVHLSVRPFLCWDNWKTLLQKTFKLGQSVYLGKILVKFEFGSSWICLSVSPFVCLSVRLLYTFFMLALLMSTHNMFLREKMCCWYLLEAPQWGTFNEYPQHVFMQKLKKK